jgi:hypothetical protein
MNEQINNQPEKKEQVIWEEKNSNELEKSCNLKIEKPVNDIINDTKKNEIPLVCENIGKEERRRIKRREANKKYKVKNKDKIKKYNDVYNKKYRLSHKNETKEYTKKYYQEHVDSLIHKSKEYRTNNKEKVKQTRKMHYVKNKGIISEKHKEYYKKNKLALNIASKLYRDNNQEKIKAYNRNNYKVNRHKMSISNREYRNKNKTKLDIKRKEYVIKNKEKINIRSKNYSKTRKKLDINFRLKCNLRSRLTRAIRNNQKSGSAVKDLGCSVEYFKHYIAGKFIPGMTWENYGSVWHLDHIVPLSSFDLTNREEFLNACHYTNYQPLWATTAIAREHGDMISIGNIEKGNR